MSASSNTSDREGRRSGGDFRERKLDVSSITFGDFANPRNFFHLFSQDDSVVHEWCRQKGLLATGFPCPVDDCSGNMDLRSLSRGHGGVVFRCSSNRNHTRVSRMYSFFEKSRYSAIYKVLPREEQPRPVFKVLWVLLHINCSKLGILHPWSVQGTFFSQICASTKCLLGHFCEVNNFEVNNIFLVRSWLEPTPTMLLFLHRQWDKRHHRTLISTHPE